MLANLAEAKALDDRREAEFGRATNKINALVGFWEKVAEEGREAAKFEQALQTLKQTPHDTEKAQNFFHRYLRGKGLPVPPNGQNSTSEQKLDDLDEEEYEAVLRKESKDLQAALALTAPGGRISLVDVANLPYAQQVEAWAVALTLQAERTATTAVSAVDVAKVPIAGPRVHFEDWGKLPKEQQLAILKRALILQAERKELLDRAAGHAGESSLAALCERLHLEDIDTLSVEEQVSKLEEALNLQAAIMAHEAEKAAAQQQQQQQAEADAPAVANEAAEQQPLYDQGQEAKTLVREAQAAVPGQAQPVQSAEHLMMAQMAKRSAPPEAPANPGLAPVGEEPASSPQPSSAGQIQKGEITMDMCLRDPRLYEFFHRFLTDFVKKDANVAEFWKRANDYQHAERKGADARKLQAMAKEIVHLHVARHGLSKMMMKMGFEGPPSKPVNLPRILSYMLAKERAPSTFYTLVLVVSKNFATNYLRHCYLDAFLSAAGLEGNADD